MYHYITHAPRRELNHFSFCFCENVTGSIMAYVFVFHNAVQYLAALQMLEQEGLYMHQVLALEDRIVFVGSPLAVGWYSHLFALHQLPYLMEYYVIIPPGPIGSASGSD